MDLIGGILVAAAASKLIDSICPGRSSDSGGYGLGSSSRSSSMHESWTEGSVPDIGVPRGPMIWNPITRHYYQEEDDGYEWAREVSSFRYNIYPKILDKKHREMFRSLGREDEYIGILYRQYHKARQEYALKASRRKKACLLGLAALAIAGGIFAYFKCRKAPEPITPQETLPKEISTQLLPINGVPATATSTSTIPSVAVENKVSQQGWHITDAPMSAIRQMYQRRRG